MYPFRQSCQLETMPRKSQHAHVTHGEHLKFNYTSTMINVRI